MDELMQTNECSPPAAHAEKAEALFPIYEAPDTATATLKRGYRRMVLNLLSIQDAATTGHAKRSAAEAITLLETSAMFAVKAVHQG